ncbi:HAAAP family serine/threonine permease [Legionella sp. W05-934-2]|uniref:HAAAP family serine/threonine permease n=1 Tax=Legionella sp. W05-934-2 TaxID=1198649 RepID=UPI003462D433
MTQVTIESLEQSNTPLNSSWNKQDTLWTLSLYGTAIGAGTLFLPINAGINGLLPLLIMTILAFPMTYYAHRGLSRFVLSSPNKHGDITDVAKEYYGQRSGLLITFFYFFAIFPILLMYSVAITNTAESFWVNQLHFQPISRPLLSGGLLTGLMLVIVFGQQMVLRSMSMLVYPFVIVLLALSCYLIPSWNLSYWIHSLNNSPSLLSTSTMSSIAILIPVMVFSFNHSPIISSFALQQKQTYGKDADQKSCQILATSHLLMIATVMFFVFSCVFTLTPEDMQLAKHQNISILSYLANYFHQPFISLIAPIIAFVAIAKSFFGHYLGAREGLKGLWQKEVHPTNPLLKKAFLPSIDLSILGACWIVATINPSILGMIETLGGPIIAIILFLMPMHALYRIERLKAYRQTIADIFTTIIGLLALSAILYKLLG